MEIRDIVLPPELLRAMARQAEAERERRAKVIAATGELGASKELAEAAATLYESPGAMQLRTLQTLAEVASENNSTLVFPLPIEILAGFVNGTIGMSSPGGGAAATRSRPRYRPPVDGDAGAIGDRGLGRGGQVAARETGGSGPRVEGGHVPADDRRRVATRANRGRTGSVSRRSGPGPPRPWCEPGRPARVGTGPVRPPAARRTKARIRTARRAAFLAPLTATVATGTPLGIWTMASSESRPPRLARATGTPITGSGVAAARTPARWAAPPAAAMSTWTPRSAAVRANSMASSGVRWAEMTRTSTGTPNERRVWTASSMIDASDELPMTMATDMSPYCVRPVRF